MSNLLETDVKEIYIKFNLLFGDKTIEEVSQEAEDWTSRLEKELESDPSRLISDTNGVKTYTSLF